MMHIPTGQKIVFNKVDQIQSEKKIFKTCSFIITIFHILKTNQFVSSCHNVVTHKEKEGMKSSKKLSNLKLKKENLINHFLRQEDMYVQ